MSIKTIRNPITLAFAGSETIDGIPDVTEISYDLQLLRIVLKFEGADRPVNVIFDGVRGFRVLDEGDLLEFWDQSTRAEGWLWRVDQGGWFDLEKIREGFVSGVTGGYKEFLVLGQNECVSVITSDAPTIEASRS